MGRMIIWYVENSIMKTEREKKIRSYSKEEGMKHDVSFRRERLKAQTKLDWHRRSSVNHIHCTHPTGYAKLKILSPTHYKKKLEWEAGAQTWVGLWKWGAGKFTRVLVTNHYWVGREQGRLAMHFYTTTWQREVGDRVSVGVCTIPIHSRCLQGIQVTTHTNTYTHTHTHTYICCVKSGGGEGENYGRGHTYIRLHVHVACS